MSFQDGFLQWQYPPIHVDKFEKIHMWEANIHTRRTAERGGGRRGHCPVARGHRGTRGSELSGLECKIHQLKLRPAGAMMLFFDFGPKFEHPRTL